MLALMRTYRGCCDLDADQTEISFALTRNVINYTRAFLFVMLTWLFVVGSRHYYTYSNMSFLTKVHGLWYVHESSRMFSLWYVDNASCGQLD